MTHYYLNTSRARTLLVILVINALFGLTNLSAMYCCASQSPEKEFLSECKGISDNLKDYADALCIAITTGDIRNINNLFDSYTPILSRNIVTPGIHHLLRTILHTTYPDLEDLHNEAVWKYQETKNYPALKIVVTLLNYLARYEDYTTMDGYHDGAFPSKIDPIWTTVYNRVLHLCRKSKKVSHEALSHHVMDTMEELDKIAKKQVISASQQPSVSYVGFSFPENSNGADNRCALQVCTPSGCTPAALARQRSGTSLVNGRRADSPYPDAQLASRLNNRLYDINEDRNGENGGDENGDDEKQAEFSDLPTGQQKPKPIILPRYQEEFARLTQIHPSIADLLLSRRGTIFQEFQNLPF